MNIPGVCVWKAGNGIFIEYFWEYLWETLVITSAFVLLRHDFCFHKLHRRFSLSPFLSLSLFVSHCIYSTFLSVWVFQQPKKLSQYFNLNLIPYALK